MRNLNINFNIQKFIIVKLKSFINDRTVHKFYEFLKQDG
jgi:hypothetical protein